MRARPIALRILAGINLFPLIACGSGDLLLPSSGDPAALRLVSGDLQQADAGTRLPDPLVVEVVDANGRPVAGSRILFRFELASDGGQVSPDTVQTDESGQATATVRLGDEPGAHPVEAAVVDAAGLRVRFLLTALEPDQGGTGGGGGNGGNGGNDDGGGGFGDGGGGGGGGGTVDGGGGDDDDGGGGSHQGKGKGKGGKGKDDD